MTICFYCEKDESNHNNNVCRIILINRITDLVDQVNISILKQVLNYILNFSGYKL